MAQTKPVVVIDARMVGNIGHGIGMYVEDLAAGLSLRGKKNPLLYEPIFLLHETPRSDSALHDFSTIHVDIPFLSPKEIFLLPLVLRRRKAALYHSPSFSSLLLYPCPHIITVHDLNHLHFGSLRERFYYSTLLRKAIHGAARVFSVSDFSRNELEDWLPGLKVEIARNAIHPIFAPASNESANILKKFGLKAGSFFFSLSNPKPHKNLDLLRQAYRKYRNKTENALPLVLSVSGESEPGILYTGPLSKMEIAVLLQNCSAFYFPSLYEGFGRPPLEAALLGTPIVASAIPAHEEALQVLSEQEKTLLSPYEESLWESAFHAGQANALPKPGAEATNKILMAYNVENLGNVMDKAYRTVLGL